MSLYRTAVIVASRRLKPAAQRHFGISARSISLAIAAFPVMTTLVAAQEHRTRSLTFDPDKREWVEAPTPTPGTAEGDLYVIKTLNDEGDFRQAIGRVKAFIKRFGKDDALYPDAFLQRAEALIGRKNFTDAHETLQEFLGEFGGSSLTDDALRMELVTAEAFLAGAKRRVWRIFRFSGKDLAYRILDEIAAGYPDSRYAEAAIKTKADHLYKEGEFDLAEPEYARLLREYPRTQYHQFALRRTADAALASFAGVNYDEAALIESEERYREYRATYPAVARREDVDVILDGIRQSRAEKDYLVAEYYARTDHRSSAVFYYELVQRDWPGTIAAAKATDRLSQWGLEQQESIGGEHDPSEGD